LLVKREGGIILSATVNAAMLEVYNVSSAASSSYICLPAVIARSANNIVVLIFRFPAF